MTEGRASPFSVLLHTCGSDTVDELYKPDRTILTLAFFKKQAASGKTADNKQAIIEFITQKSIAKTAEIADAVGLSQPRVRVLLAELIAEGIIESQGEGKARAYILKE